MGRPGGRPVDRPGGTVDLAADAVYRSDGRLGG